MLLEDKNAVIYGGSGSVGGAVARAFVREGAKVFLAGRTQAKLDKVAAEIRSAGRPSTGTPTRWRTRPAASTSPSTRSSTTTSREPR